MTPVERGRDQLRKQFEDAYYRCRRDPMEGLSFTEEDMVAAIERSLNIFRATDDPASQAAAPAAVKESTEYEEEEEGTVEEEIGVLKVGDTVCSSLSFLICKYLYQLVQRKITFISLQFALNAFLQCANDMYHRR